jgi:hypothetical protein
LTSIRDALAFQIQKDAAAEQAVRQNQLDLLGESMAGITDALDANLAALASAQNELANTDPFKTIPGYWDRIKQGRAEGNQFWVKPRTVGDPDYPILQSEIATLQQQIAASQQELQAVMAAFEKLNAAPIEVPQFARGGRHFGGLRIVGENGPELEYTGASQIYNARQTRDMLSGAAGDPAHAEDLRRLLLEVVKNTKRTSDIARKHDVDGMPPVRV